MVIGIEGLVGAGKTSICRNLLEYIPNSILLHGGNIYRAVVCGVMKSGIDLKSIATSMEKVDAEELLKKLKIEIQIKNRESIILMNGKEIEEEELQSDKTSMAVSMASNVADNRNLYQFGNKLIEQFKQKYNIILSSRDIMKMYPETDYHFLITASLEERINRKYIQYKGNLSKEEIRENIMKRDALQEDAGYYKEYSKTKKIDVTDCETIEKATQKVLAYIKIPVLD